MTFDAKRSARARVVGMAAAFVLLGLVLLGVTPSLSTASAVLVAVTALLTWVVLVWSMMSRERGSRAAAAAAKDALGNRTARVRTLHEDLAARDTVLSAMSEGVLLFDPAGRLAYANPAAQAILGRRFETAAEVAQTALREAIQEVGELSAPRRQTEPAICQFETSDAVIEATALPAGAPGTVVVVLRDVTSARSVERLRRDFVANASHELKTPVAAILALSGSLRAAAGGDPEALARFLPQLEQQAERLAALVGDLLELSRLEAGARERAVVHLDHVVEAETERFRVRATAAGLQLSATVSGPLPVSGSEADLANVVNNLLDNAIRYTPAGGEVTVAAGQVDGAAQLSVDDTGIGIPSRDLDRIFERFYRVDSARSRQTGGTGLGLSIVRHVAEAHGGTVQVRSALGAGSTFTVRLPLLDGAGIGTQSLGNVAGADRGGG